MQSNFLESEKNSLNNNNLENINTMEAAECSAQQEKKKVIADDHQNFNELHDNDEDLDNNAAYSDSDDDQFINSFEEDSIESPSNSINSDGDQQWYAYRGRWGINLMENQHGIINGEINHHQIENRLPLNNHHQQQQQQQQQNNVQQDEEETDFLEMDFEPDTNSEIENDNEARFSSDSFDLRHGHNINPTNDNQISHQQHNNNNNNNNNLFKLNQPATASSSSLASNEQQQQDNLNRINKNTGAVKKQFSLSNRKSPKCHQQHATDGDNIFRITGHLSNETSSFNNHHHYKNDVDDDVYNIGASCSSKCKTPLLNENPYHISSHYHHQNDVNNFIKPHKSPSKSSHHSHKQQRLHEEQNDLFLFEIEPIKPRNSVTIYTSNCDEKILMDALTSLKLKPDREMIMNYFNKSRPLPDMKLVDYIIFRSKMNCNYMKLIEIIQRACKTDDDEEYNSAKKFDINFYPLDFFSTTPEMIDVDVCEIVKRWTPQTDLSPLVHIKNKYFIQTNVLGKLVNIIRRINNQKPPIFRDNETIKIPQFYVSGYITITTMRNQT